MADKQITQRSNGSRERANSNYLPPATSEGNRSNNQNFQNPNSTTGAFNYSRTLLYSGDMKETGTQAFKYNRVRTASYIERRGNDYIAHPFYKKPEKSYADKIPQSMHYSGHTNDTYQKHPLQHVGMEQKPLHKYDPNAHRSRLPSSDFQAYYVNRSVVEIGDRTIADQKHWLSSKNNVYQGQQPWDTPCNHPQIFADRFRWTHKMQNK